MCVCVCLSVLSLEVKMEIMSSWEIRVYIGNPCHAVGSKIVVVSTNHVTFLTNRFPRLISLPTSAIFVSGTSGITAILKYRSVSPIYIYIYIYISLFIPYKTYLPDKFKIYCS